VLNRLLRLTGTAIILLAGVVLLTVGALCLYLSGAAARSGSWLQATLDAFGVGFIVGGVVDVTAMSLLNYLLTVASARESESRNRRAAWLIDKADALLDQPGQFLTLSYATWCDMTIELSRFLDLQGDRVDQILRRQMSTVLGQLYDPAIADTDDMLVKRRVPDDPLNAAVAETWRRRWSNERETERLREFRAEEREKWFAPVEEKPR
jgi:hypothetical protein